MLGLDQTLTVGTCGQSTTLSANLPIACPLPLGAVSRLGNQRGRVAQSIERGSRRNGSLGSLQGDERDQLEVVLLVVDNAPDR